MHFCLCGILKSRRSAHSQRSCAMKLTSGVPIISRVIFHLRHFSWLGVSALFGEHTMGRDKSRTVLGHLGVPHADQGKG